VRTGMCVEITSPTANILGWKSGSTAKILRSSYVVSSHHFVDVTGSMHQRPNPQHGLGLLTERQEVVSRVLAERAPDDAHRQE
jgi:hypothetical protein